jgi:hypothetical protein
MDTRAKCSRSHKLFTLALEGEGEGESTNDTKQQRENNSVQGLFVKTTFKGNEQEGRDASVAG